MLGASHKVFGALCGATVATATGQPWSMVAMTSIVSTATSAGWSSPDIDQTGPWQKVASLVPGPLLSHRFLTHWWGLPVAAWLLVDRLPVEAHWPAYALLIGWTSHLLGDAIFGRVPLLPWGGTFVGLGLDTGGFIESGVARGRKVLPYSPARLLIGALLLFVLAGLPGTQGIPSGSAPVPTATAPRLAS